MADAEAEQEAEAIHIAVHDGVVEDINTLLDEDGARVGAVTREGYTPLIIAAVRGHVEVVRLLLRRGADIDAVDNEGRTALNLAVCCSVEEVVTLLLEHGADPHRPDSTTGLTPLMIASHRGNTHMLRMLLRSLKGQGLDTPAGNGVTALVIACFNGHAEVTRLLLLEGASHNCPQHDNVTARMVAQSKGRHECAALIQVRMQGRGEEGWGGVTSG